MIGGGTGLSNYYSSSSFFSFWWKDILKIKKSFYCDPIVDCCRFSVNNGFNTPFWEAKWLVGASLKVIFLDLFEASSLMYVSVASMGSWGEEGWKWGDFSLGGLIALGEGGGVN